MTTATAKKTAKRDRNNKPEKPYDGFPMFAHSNGRWAKKINYKMHYFGRWDDAPQGTGGNWQQALKLYERNAPLIKAGIPVDRRANRAGGCLLKAAIDSYIEEAEKRVALGDLNKRSAYDIRRELTELVPTFGGLALDQIGRAELSKVYDWARVGKGGEAVKPSTLKKRLGHVRAMLNHAKRTGLTDADFPLDALKKPTLEEIEKSQADVVRLYSRDEIQKIRLGGDLHISTMALLALNCGFGHQDLSQLKAGHIDMETGAVILQRSKTKRNRIAFLWPETLAAVKLCLGETFNDESPVFAVRTNAGFGNKGEARTARGMSNTWGEWMDRLGISREGRGFYSLRHTFATEAAGAGDQVAVNAIMGHADETQAATYREGITLERIKAACFRVKDWLDGNIEDGPKWDAKRGVITNA